MKQKFTIGVLAAAALLAAVAAGGYAFHPQFLSQAQARTAAPAQPTASSPIATQALPDFAAIAERYGAAVVNISVTQNVKAGLAPQVPGLQEGDPFFEFFRRFGVPAPGGETPAQGMGSGFIVSPDGMILTNAHVVRDASEVTVRLTDKREFRAKVVGTDPQTDVAVLKIEASNLPTVRLGEPSRVRVGEWVVAIGSPYGFENSVTAGIVSAKARSLPDGTYVPFIQTDVAVNPGNSGGPLFNLKGEVIGINSQIYSRTGGYQGLSFAIPIDLASRIQDQLVRHGKVTRGRIGVTIQEVNQSLAESFGLDKPAGALVSSVDRNGPAGKAGVQPGDVILKVDGKPVERLIDVSGIVAEHRPGTTVRLEVWRKGAPREIAVKVGEMASPRTAAAGTGGGEDSERLGLAVRPLTPDERKQVGVEAGLLVENVSAGGAAARAGVRPGDIVIAINSTPVASVEDLRKLAKRSGKRAALLVQRDEARIYVPLNLG